MELMLQNYVFPLLNSPMGYLRARVSEPLPPSHLPTPLHSYGLLLSSFFSGFGLFPLCSSAVVLGAALLQPAPFPRRAGAEECRGAGQTGPDRGQRNAGQSGGRHRSADAGQQPGARSVGERGELVLGPMASFSG